MEDLRLYAVLRTDITMSSGKVIAQAGHAFLDALLFANVSRDPRTTAYAALKPGTKIALAGGDAQALVDLHRKLNDAGVPAVLIVDRDHVEPPHFDGSPILTALGVGPIGRSQARRLLGRLPLWGRDRKGGAP